MKKIFFSVAFFAVVLGGGQAMAGGWTAPTTVTKIYPFQGEGVLIELAAMHDFDGCAATDFYVLEKSNQFFDENFALLLSAKERQTTVNVYVHGCSARTNSKQVISAIISK